MLEQQAEDSEEEEADGEGAGAGGIDVDAEESTGRSWSKQVTQKREAALAKARADGTLEVQEALHVDDLSSDDEKAGNTIGRVPLRWYEDQEHIGYDVSGNKIAKREKQDGMDAALAAKDDPNFKRTVYDGELARPSVGRSVGWLVLVLPRDATTTDLIHRHHPPPRSTTMRTTTTCTATIIHHHPPSSTITHPPSHRTHRTPPRPSSE